MLIVGRLFLGVGIGLANQVSNICYTYQDSDKQHTYFCLHVSRLTAGSAVSHCSLTVAKLQR